MAVDKERPGPTLLVVDDEPAIRRFLRVVLSAQGYTVVEASTVSEAVKAVAEACPDVVVLDLGLPDGSGLTVIERVRVWSKVPIIVLTVLERETDKVAALDAGADDYVTKPFGAGELSARIRAALRRVDSPDEPVFRSGDLVVDRRRRRIELAGVEVQTTPIELDLLGVLAEHGGRVLTHRQLLLAVWGAGYETESHLLRVHVSNLRRKLEPDPANPRYLLTEPGVGYRLSDNA
jgi:two-component system KDP operon response regulator KdpE